MFKVVGNMRSHVPNCINPHVLRAREQKWLHMQYSSCMERSVLMSRCSGFGLHRKP